MKNEKLLRVLQYMETPDTGMGMKSKNKMSKHSTMCFQMNKKRSGFHGEEAESPEIQKD